MGFEKPNEIQEQALPILLGAPTDFIGQAADLVIEPRSVEEELEEKVPGTHPFIEFQILRQVPNNWKYRLRQELSEMQRKVNSVS